MQILVVGIGCYRDRPNSAATRAAQKLGRACHSVAGGNDIVNDKHYLIAAIGIPFDVNRAAHVANTFYGGQLFLLLATAFAAKERLHFKCTNFCRTRGKLGGLVDAVLQMCTARARQIGQDDVLAAPAFFLYDVLYQFGKTICKKRIGSIVIFALDEIDQAVLHKCSFAGNVVDQFGKSSAFCPPHTLGHTSAFTHLHGANAAGFKLLALPLGKASRTKRGC